MCKRGNSLMPGTSASGPSQEDDDEGKSWWNDQLISNFGDGFVRLIRLMDWFQFALLCRHIVTHSGCQEHKMGCQVLITPQHHSWSPQRQSTCKGRGSWIADGSWWDSGPFFDGQWMNCSETMANSDSSELCFLHIFSTSDSESVDFGWIYVIFCLPPWARVTMLPPFRSTAMLGASQKRNAKGTDLLEKLEKQLSRWKKASSWS